MTDASRPLAARERAALADLLDDLGPDAPTCCDGWTTAHMAAHLVTRDRRPDAMPGYALERTPIGGRLHAHAGRVEDRLRTTTPSPELVARVRQGPPGWLPGGWPVAQLVDGPEFAIHHEDVRRAQPGWEPRALPLPDADRLWSAAQLFARTAAPRYPGKKEDRHDQPIQSLHQPAGTSGPRRAPGLPVWRSAAHGLALIGKG